MTVKTTLKNRNQIYKLLRNALGMTQEEFGEIFGLERRTVCDVEKGRIAMGTKRMEDIEKKLNAEITITVKFLK